MESSGYYPLKPSLSRKETIQSATILALQRLLGKEKKENIIEFPPCLRQKKGLQIAIGGSRPFGKTHHTHPGRQTLKTLLHAPDSRLTIPPVYKDIPGQVKGITEEGHSEDFLFNDPTKLNAQSGYQSEDIIVRLVVGNDDIGFLGVDLFFEADKGPYAGGEEHEMGPVLGQGKAVLSKSSIDREKDFF